MIGLGLRLDVSLRVDIKAPYEKGAACVARMALRLCPLRWT